MNKSMLQNLLGRAEADSKTAHAALTEKRANLIAAEGRYDASGSKRDRDDLLTARVECERAERISKKADETLALAKKKHEHFLHEETVAKYEKLKEQIVAAGDKIALHADTFVGIDRSLEQAVMAVAEDVRAALELYEQAARLAYQLQRTTDFERSFPARPDLASANLTVLRTLTEARQKENRPELGPVWLSGSSIRWEDRAFSAAELASIRAYQEAQARADRQAIDDAAAVTAKTLNKQQENSTHV